MEIDSEECSVVDRDLWNISSRHQQAFVVEGVGIVQPSQSDQPSGRRRRQRRFVNVNLSLSVSVCDCGRLHLQAGENSRDVVPCEDFDHLEVRKRTEQVQAWSLRQPPDHFGLAQEPEPCVVAFAWLQPKGSQLYSRSNGRTQNAFGE